MKTTTTIILTRFRAIGQMIMFIQKASIVCGLLEREVAKTPLWITREEENVLHLTTGADNNALTIRVPIMSSKQLDVTGLTITTRLSKMTLTTKNALEKLGGACPLLYVNDGLRQAYKIFREEEAFNNETTPVCEVLNIRLDNDPLVKYMMMSAHKIACEVGNINRTGLASFAKVSFNDDDELQVTINSQDSDLKICIPLDASDDLIHPSTTIETRRGFVLLAQQVTREKNIQEFLHIRHGLIHVYDLILTYLEENDNEQQHQTN